MPRVLMVLISIAAFASCPRVRAQPADPPAAQTPWDDWRPPEVTMPKPNALDLYRQAFELIAASKGYGDERDRRAMRAYLKENREALRLLRKALRGECRLPLPKDYFDMATHLMAGFRSGARLLSMQASARREHARYLDAAQASIHAMRLGHDVATQRTLISLLVGIACEAIGRQALEQTIPHMSARDSLTAIQWLQEAEKERIPFVETVQGEAMFPRRTFIAFTQELASPDADLAEVERQNELPPGSLTDLAKSWRAMDKLIAASLGRANQPYWQPVPEIKAQDALAELFVSPDLLRSGRTHVTRGEAQLHLAVPHLAAHAYWQNEGKPPAILDALVPDYLAEVPTDPFSGKPLQSSARDGEFVVYSVGPDGVDDGGKDIGVPFEQGAKGDIAVRLAVPQ